MWITYFGAIKNIWGEEQMVTQVRDDASIRDLDKAMLKMKGFSTFGKRLEIQFANLGTIHDIEYSSNSGDHAYENVVGTWFDGRGFELPVKSFFEAVQKCMEEE